MEKIQDSLGLVKIMGLTKAKDIFPEFQENTYDEQYDYDKIVETFGTILDSVKNKGYDGDTIYLLQKDNQFGYLVVGWGSCSGCDALMSCNTFAEIDALIEQLYLGIVWYDSKEELYNYINNKDCDLEYSSGLWKELQKIIA